MDQNRLRSLAARFGNAVGSAPLRVERAFKSGLPKWWLVGTIGGDVALPASRAKTAEEAVSLTEKWLGLEFRFDRAEDCPDVGNHTPVPSGYLERAEDAERRVARGQYSERCQTCGFWAIWRTKSGRKA
jgi:hypothetical protein